MMKLKSLTTPTALLAAFTLFSAPSFAQQREYGGQGRQGGRDRSTQESGGRSAERAQPRANGVTPRTESGRQAVSPRAESRSEVVSPRFESRGQAVSPRFENRGNGSVQRAVPRVVESR